MYKLAIVGASTGQKQICETARKMGLFTIGFAWENGAICKGLFSKFYPISVTDMEQIAQICAHEQIDGIVSNASDLTAETVTYVADKLELVGNSYSDYVNAKNKFFVRQATNYIDGLTPVRAERIMSGGELFYPAVIKPVSGSGKRGICFVKSEADLDSAMHYALNASSELMIESFITADYEVSVETISCAGRHWVVQITDKDVTGAPHFVEIGHHQPSALCDDLKAKIASVVPKILDAINFINGAAHIEIKIDVNTQNLYLVEVNMRGGGDEISNTLVNLSTDFDYIRAMIEVALGIFNPPIHINNTNNAGIYYLCHQTQDIFEKINASNINIISKEINSGELTHSTTNYDRNGYIIYCDKMKPNMKEGDDNE